MIVTRNTHAKQDFTCGESVANVNLYNGNLIVEYALEKIGLNTFEIGTSIVFNTNYKNTDFNGKKIGFGNGWKLNLHQYLLQYDEEYNLEGFDTSDYLYIDGQWNVHRFVYYYTDTINGRVANLFYNADNATTKLYVFNTITTNENYKYKIIDDLGNELRFNSNGELVELVSSINEEIVKKIVYSNGRLLNIYDTRDDSKKIFFDYDSNNMLKKVHNSRTTICYNLNFQNNKLMSISKSETALHKYKIANIYNSSGKLEYIINNTDLTALKIEYLYSNNYYKVSKVLCGSVENCIIKDFESELYVSNNTYLEDDQFLSDNTPKFKSYEYLMANDYVKSSVSYIYGGNYTDITDKKNKSIRYYLNTKGQIISQLDVQPNDDFYSLNKQYGAKVSVDGLSSIKFNNSNCLKVNNRELSIANEKMYDIIDQICVQSDSDIIYKFKKYSFGFWIMSNKKIENAYVKLSHSEMIRKSKKFFLGNVLPNTWQYVSIDSEPFSNNQYFTDVKLEFINFENDADIYISDIFVNGSMVPSAVITNWENANEPQFHVSSMCQMFYIEKDSNNDEKVIYEIDAYHYMTDNDLILTYNSLSLSKLKDIDYYELYYCNNTKTVLVKDAGLVLGPPYLSEPYEFMSFKLQNNKQNFYLELKFTKTVDTWDTLRYHFNVEEDLNVFDYYYVKKKEHTVTNSYGNIVDDKNYYHIETTYLNGLKRGVEYENGLVIDYHYDNYGNIERIWSQNILKDYGDSVSELLSINYNYGSTPEKLRSIANSVTKNGEITNYLINNINGNINQVYNDKNSVTYSYDRFNEDINEITFEDTYSSLPTYSNSYLYNKNGNIKGIININSSYGFRYNAFSELDSIYKNSELIEKFISEENEESLSTIIRTYKSSNEFNEIRRLYNNDGNLSKVFENGNKKIECVYKGLTDCSPKNKVLDIIEDKYRSVLYRFVYDDVFNGYVSISDGELNLKLYNNGNFEYNKLNDAYKIKYSVEKNLINGLLQLTSYKSLSADDEVAGNIAFSADGFEEFNYEYKYDEFLRCVSKQNNKKKYLDNSNNETASIYMNKRISYVKNKSLIYGVYYDVNSIIDSQEYTATIRYLNNYVNNKISSLYEFLDRFVTFPINENQKTIATEQNQIYRYSYDSFDRLIKEVNPYFGELDYIYDDNNGMLKKIKKNNIDICTYNYSGDKLTSIQKDGILKSISYDKIGNIIAYGDSQITYNSRGLMESYSYYDSNDNFITFIYYYDYQNRRYKIEKKITNDSGTTTQYIKKLYYNGNIVIREDIEDLTATNAADIYKTLNYFYDSEGICGIKYLNKNYTLLKDPLLNVSYIVRDGKAIGKYRYDAWGNFNVLEFENNDSDDIYVLYNNPFRYNGYYNDVEAQLVLVSSRYYSPELRRFIQPVDVFSLNSQSVNGLNLYVYCMNNPVNYKQAPVSFDNSFTDSSLFGIIGGRFMPIISPSSGGSSRVDWENGGFQIPIWISSLMSGSDFGASIAPALRTVYQYIRYPVVKDLNKLYGLDFVPGKLNNVCSAIGYGLLALNIGLSAWSNFTNDNLTSKQQWISFGVDTAYTLGSFGIGYGVGVLVSLIPGVGVFIAPFVSAGVTWFIDWTNEKWGWLDDVKQWFNDL